MTANQSNSRYVPPRIDSLTPIGRRCIQAFCRIVSPDGFFINKEVVEEYYKLLVSTVEKRYFFDALPGLVTQSYALKHTHTATALKLNPPS